MTSSLSSSATRQSFPYDLARDTAESPAIDYGEDRNLADYFEVCQASSTSSLDSSRSSTSHSQHLTAISLLPQRRPREDDCSASADDNGTAKISKKSIEEPSSSASAGPSTRIVNTTRTSLSGELLQGNVSRPLLQRSRSSSQRLTGETVFYIPSRLEEEEEEENRREGSAAVPASRHRCTTPHLVQEEHDGISTVASRMMAGAPLRTPAGRPSLVTRLQTSTMPTVRRKDLSVGASDSMAASATSAFAFFMPPAGPLPASTVAKNIRKGKGSQPPSTITTAKRGDDGDHNSVGGSLPPQCAPSPSRLSMSASICRARQRAVLFDVLCALRQQSTASCERRARKQRCADLSNTPDPGTPEVSWGLRDAVYTEAQTQVWALSFVGALEQLLEVADEVAIVDYYGSRLSQSPTYETSLGATTEPFGHTRPLALSSVDRSHGDSYAAQNADTALETAALHTLERLCAVMRSLSADFARWVLQMQEQLLLLCERAAAREINATGKALSFSAEREVSLQARWKDEEGGDCTAVDRPPPSHSARVTMCDRSGSAEVRTTGGQNGAYVLHSEGFTLTATVEVLPAPCSLMDVVSAVIENAMPLRRCRLLVEESGCLDGLSRSTVAATLSAESVAKLKAPASKSSQTPRALLAARLLDTLIIQASAFQDVATMDLYRFYVMLLIHLSWPYVLLCTAAIFGFVWGIDPSKWRRQLPRLFRSSFSHIRVGDATHQYPTDILSLMLNCVGYYNGAAVSATGERPQEAGKGRACGAADVTWKSSAWRGDNKSSSRKGLLSRDLSEEHVARAALISARKFVSRSLASFTRRHKQVALSRTPLPPPSTSLAPCSAKFGKKKDGDTEQVPNDAPTSWQQLQSRSMKEILRYIMYDAGDKNSSGDGVGDSPPNIIDYMQEDQDVRRRVASVAKGDAAAAVAAQTAGGAASAKGGCSHFLYYPTTIPLGFVAMQKEALPMQSHCGVSAPAEPDEDEGEPDSGDDADEHGITGNLSLLRRRGISLWTLEVSDSALAPDVRFTNALASDETRYLDACGIAGGASMHHSKRAMRPRWRAHRLWMNITIPCTRWITTALLIPIGVTVQRLHERRLRDIFRVSLQPVSTYEAGSGDAQVLRLQGSSLESPSASSTNKICSSASPSAVSPLSPVASATLHFHTLANGVASGRGSATFSFLNALKLLVDIALCRDQERLVHGFLERLYREPRWWVRRTAAEAGAESPYRRLGTASPAVSALFVDSLRGKRFGELVHLTVLPARRTATTATNSNYSSLPTIASDILDTFASFQLDFTFPAAYERILQPQDLSVYVQLQANTIMQSYQTFFWECRHGLYAEDGTAMTPAGRASAIPPTTLPVGERDSTIRSHPSQSGTATRQSPANAPLNSTSPPTDGIHFADVWSYTFGYTCALYYAQITLREQKKQLRQRDTQDAQLMQEMDLPGRRAAAHLQHVTRGLGSAYYTLNFAVDTLLSFTQSVALCTVYDVERLLRKAMGSSPDLHSCMELCYELDSLLLRLSFTAFPSRPPLLRNARERGMQSPAREAVRDSVHRILELVLDPTRLPVSHISSGIRNAVEALVAAVTAAAAAHHHQSALATHLRPLLVRLTFNRYYGSDEEVLSYRFR